jgi:hypothetical protein
MDFRGPDVIVFFAVTAAMVPFICWTIWLMYRSYATSSGLRGGKAVGTFIAALVVAEILSSLAISSLARSPYGSFFTAPQTAPKSDAERNAISAAQAWLKMIDDRDYSGSWREAARFFKSAVTMESWVGSMKQYREPAGNVISRKVLDIRTEVPPGVPAGNYVLMQFLTDFTNKHAAVETVTFTQEADGQWRAAGYYIK